MVTQRITSLHAEYVPLPLKNPFVLSIRTATHATVIRWRLGVEDGSEFQGESVPVQYVTGETKESVLAAAPKLEALLKGNHIEDLLHLSRMMEREFPNDVAARTGVEIALYNAFSSEVGISVPTLLGGKNV